VPPHEGREEEHDETEADQDEADEIHRTDVLARSGHAANRSAGTVAHAATGVLCRDEPASNSKEPKAEDEHDDSSHIVRVTVRLLRDNGSAMTNRRDTPFWPSQRCGASEM
jgi:hypothetical protein